MVDFKRSSCEIIWQTLTKMARRRVVSQIKTRARMDSSSPLPAWEAQNFKDSDLKIRLRINRVVFLEVVSSATNEMLWKVYRGCCPLLTVAVHSDCLSRAHFDADLILSPLAVIDSTVETVDASTGGAQGLAIQKCTRLRRDAEGIETQEPLDLFISLQDKSSQSFLLIAFVTCSSRLRS